MARLETYNHPRRFIWFCSTEYVADHPESLIKLRDEVGLTTIMPESHICHTSGFSASQQIARKGPFEDWKNRLDVWPRGKEGIFPPVAGTVSGFDDTPLLRVIEACKKADIEVWGHIGLWSYGGDVYPEYALQDIEGKPLDRRYKRWGIGLCPSRKKINAWTRDCLVEVTERYDIDGFDVDHARYPAPASVSSLTACGCKSCQTEAGRLGYDFEAMKKALMRLRLRLSVLTEDRLQAIVRSQPGLWDFLALLADDGAVLDWFRFRAQVLAKRMAELRQAVQEVGGANKVFGSDVFPPSTALLGGHGYAMWEKATDFLTGGSSHGGVVGWATGVTNLAGEWAAALCRTAPGLDEKDILRLIWQLFGYDDLELPLSVKGIQQKSLPIAKLYEREIARLKVQASGAVPLYPPVSAGASPELVRQLVEAVRTHKCDGCLFTVDPDDDEGLQALRTVV